MMPAAKALLRDTPAVLQMVSDQEGGQLGYGHGTWEKCLPVDSDRDVFETIDRGRAGAGVVNP